MRSKNLEYDTIRNVSQKIVDEHSFYALKGDFLDFFYAHKELREALVGEEPVERPDLPDWMLPFLAAMVHKLCNDYKLAVPSWVWRDQYYLSEPRFSHNAQGNLKAWLFVHAAGEFKHRNLFVSADTLDRA